MIVYLSLTVYLPHMLLNNEHSWWSKKILIQNEEDILHAFMKSRF